MSQQSDRGMMKWVPFQSLTEQATYLQQMRRDKHRIKKPLISEDVAREINEVLVHYSGEEIRVRYFYDGEIYTQNGVIDFIDNFAKRLRIDKKDIPFKDVLELIRL